MSNRTRLPATLALTIALGAAMTMLTACGGSDPQKTLDSLESWHSTVGLAANATHLGWVPRRYARQIRDRATAALNQTRQSPPPKQATSGDVQRIRGAEQRLQVAIDSLSVVVGS